MSESFIKVIKRLIQVAVITIIFYYLVHQLVVNWEKVVHYEWQINYYYMAASLLSVLVTFFLISIIWTWIVASFGKRISFARSFKISYLSNLGRYIPGKVWQVFGFVYLARKEGITDSEALTAFGIALTFTLPPAFTSGLLYMATYRGYFSDLLGTSLSSVHAIIFAAMILTLNALLVLYPKLFEKPLNALFRMMRRPEVKLEIDKALAIKLYVAYFLAWSLYGFSFWLFLNGILSQSVALLPMMGLFILAYQIGYLALFAPGGVGPREVVLQVLLTPFFGPSVAVAIAIAARIWSIVAEAIAALAALRIR